MSQQRAEWSISRGQTSGEAPDGQTVTPSGCPDSWAQAVLEAVSDARDIFAAPVRPRDRRLASTR